MLVNGKYTKQNRTGVQNYAMEIVKHWMSSDKEFEVVEPSKHSCLNVWEQRLSFYKRDQVLWSPCNSAPILRGKSIVTIHDMADFAHPEWFSRKYRAWHSVLRPIIANKARSIITVSEFSKQEILRWLPIREEKVKVINNGVDPVRYSPSEPRSVDAVKGKFRIDKKYIVMVGVSDPRKNVASVLKLWEKYANRLIDEWQLVLIGGRSNVLANAYLRDVKNVVFTGYVSDEELVSLYTGSDLFLYPSLYEGFGLPVLEAMACGVPILATKTGAIPEVCGDSGLLVEPGCEHDLADALEALMENEILRKKMGVQARVQAQRFSWEDAANSTWKHLQKF